MVLLTQTPAMVDAITTYRQRERKKDEQYLLPAEPDLSDAKIGKPISHEQVTTISKILGEISRENLNSSNSLPLYHLDDLLRGSRIYFEPPKPKAEPVSLFPSYQNTLLNHLRLVSIKL